MVHNAPPLPDDAPRRTKILRALRARMHRRQLSAEADERARERQRERAAEGQPQRSARAELEQAKQEVKQDPAAQKARRLKESASAATDRLSREQERQNREAEQAQRQRRQQTQREQRERTQPEQRQSISEIGAELDREFGRGARDRDDPGHDPDDVVGTLESLGDAFGGSSGGGKSAASLDDELAALDDLYD